jgi:hypothetical protein
MKQETLGIGREVRENEESKFGPEIIKIEPIEEEICGKVGNAQDPRENPPLQV